MNYLDEGIKIDTTKDFKEEVRRLGNIYAMKEWSSKSSSEIEAIYKKEGYCVGVTHGINWVLRANFKDREKLFNKIEGIVKEHIKNEVRQEEENRRQSVSKSL